MDSKILLQQLRKIKWEAKYPLYSQSFEYVRFLNQIENPKASIIIISWKYN